jgi:ATP-dependent DNA ligase
MIKRVASDTFVVGGYEPSSAGTGNLGSLLLAARKGDDLVYVGSVGTVLSARTARELEGTFRCHQRQEGRGHDQVALGRLRRADAGGRDRIQGLGG